MIKYNHFNNIEAEWFIVCNLLGRWGILENGSVNSYCMGDSVESNCKDKSDVNFLKW